MSVLPARRVRIHADDRDVVRKQGAQGVLDLLRTETHLRQIPAAALRAGGTRLRIRTDTVARSAGMAFEAVRPLVVGERRRAMPARGNASALAAHEKRREPAAVVQDDGLLASLDDLHEPVVELTGEHRAAPTGKLAPQVRDDDARKPGPARTLGHRHEPPRLTAKRSGSSAEPSLRRRGRRPEHHRYPRRRAISHATSRAW